MKLTILLSDIYRATLAEDCGNEGYIGIAPDGSSYHVVVPVDRQLARGLSPMSPPSDGTPFAGYKGWHYFCCLTHHNDKQHPDKAKQYRLERAKENAWLIERWAKGLKLDLEILDDLTSSPDDNLSK